MLLDSRVEAELECGVPVHLSASIPSATDKSRPPRRVGPRDHLRRSSDQHSSRRRRYHFDLCDTAGASIARFIVAQHPPGGRPCLPPPPAATPRCHPGGAAHRPPWRHPPHDLTVGWSATQTAAQRPTRRNDLAHVWTTTATPVRPLLMPPYRPASPSTLCRAQAKSQPHPPCHIRCAVERTNGSINHGLRLDPYCEVTLIAHEGLLVLCQIALRLRRLDRSQLFDNL